MSTTEILGSNPLLLVVFVDSLLIILFHLGKYPPPLALPRSRRREYSEAGIIFGVILAIYLLKGLFPAVFTWAVFASVTLVVGLGLLFIMERIVRGRNISSVGFRSPINRNVLIIFTGVLMLLLIGGILLHFLLRIEFSYLNVYFISGVVVGPFAEETIFRSLMQTRLEAGLGTVKSWLFTGLLFGFYHYWANYLVVGKTLTFPSITYIIFTAVFGMLLGVVFAKTRSLLPPFLLHAVNNFIALYGTP